LKRNNSKKILEEEYALKKTLCLIIDAASYIWKEGNMLRYNKNLEEFN